VHFHVCLAPPAGEPAHQPAWCHGPADLVDRRSRRRCKAGRHHAQLSGIPGLV